MTIKTTPDNPTYITTKKFKFTNANLKSLPSNPSNSSSTELEVSDIDINQARKVARKYKGMIADGIDPKAERCFKDL